MSRRFVLAAHFGHDASVALVGKGTLAHYEKERFSRIRHDSGDIKDLFHFMMSAEGIQPEEILCVVGTTVSDHFNSTRSRDSWTNLMEVDEARTSFFGPDLPCYWIPHHTAHLAYAFYASPFDTADALVIDGYGDPFKGRHSDHAVGHIYHPIGTQYGVWNVEQPEPVWIGKNWDDLSTKLFGSWHQAGTVMAMVGIPEENFTELTGFDLSVKKAVDELQKRTNETFCSFFTREYYPAVLSGGCALNGIANYKVLEKCDRVSVPPAASDSGISVGAALYGLHVILNKERELYTPDIVAFAGYKGDFAPVDREQIAQDIIAGNIVALASGRAESGPRALGHRSFLADPCSMEMRDMLNQIKERQVYRPVAPIVLRSFADDYFHLIDKDAYNYMTVIAPAKDLAKKEIPAALHYDGSARVQIAPAFGVIEKILWEMVAMGRPPVLLNTSLNLKGMPLVNSQADIADIIEKMGGVVDGGGTVLSG